MEEIIIENWLPIKGYEGLYEISDLGRIKSLSRYIPSRPPGVRLLPERILKPFLFKGYLNYSLYDKDRIQYSVRSSILIAEHFIRPLKKGELVTFKDNDRTNLKLSNISIMSLSELYREGVRKTSSTSPADILDIYRLAHSGTMTQKEIANKYHMTVTNISHIKRGVTWSQITGHTA